MSCDPDFAPGEGFDIGGGIRHAARATGEPLECASRAKVLTAERGVCLGDLDANNLRLS